MSRKWWCIGVAVVILFAVGAGAFWWYEWRPYQARKLCADKVLKLSQLDDIKITDIDILPAMYSLCLSGKGIRE